MSSKTKLEVINPAARVADLIGLLYVLHHTFSGNTDLYQLEKIMEVDLDDLMPIVYTANSLGFVTIGEGDIVITDKGIEFVNAGLKKRKEMIKSSIKKVEPFVSAIRLKKFTVRELFEELRKNSIQNFNNPSGLYLLELTLIEWGVYSGLLKRVGDVYQVVSQ
ncbi:ABC transporter ATP-binding protein [Candidatus Marsarchaeota G1 archaeon OSP_B]|uniref:ABC transporter ATP-binding protein n=4 Tax=Candidatus Marsarchaeota group 1 TaxID=2203770 RepID=A0A2R6AFK8_9ARCH|nr:MAG: ABC transporter ATP-binding protein [Candidatus Marsarchaeota G1 archaeon OSP_D]PSN85167.1 MAG: ABC transporter ATP-binding protein [Candidatus Marsarchaeota G1 archaeon BE_D]PSN88702.1 MAG: ABC transporter ATP-binding protein [Candidatus Marsarchaeota G1 archaeon OSP_C]PSN92996.1 MAG: ABC transporter ATP-binding protein [Candidatus Marsarchaeota G1 archaeon OSP_B]